MSASDVVQAWLDADPEDRATPADFREALEELLDVAGSVDLGNLETQPEVMTEAGKLHYLLDRTLTSASLAEGDAEHFRVILQAITEVRLMTEDAVADRPEVTRHAIEAAAYHRILGIIERGKVRHVSTEPDRVLESLLRPEPTGKRCGAYAVEGDPTSGPCLHPARYQDSGSNDWCACHYGEPADPAECKR